MTAPTPSRFPYAKGSDGTRRLGYGADYNPEQWPREVWEEDVRLMREAGVNVVSLAIFSWARLQPTADTWDFGWLDEIMDLLHAHGVGVDLATATASPPPWLTTAHPEILPVTATGETLWPGARQHWRPTSPVFREHALRLVREIATRYADHPALVAWHVNNELGCHNVYDYSDDAARAFRAWLRRRHTTLDALNDAWGTAFWSQRYSDWEQILPPRLAASHPNPTQQLDFKRFSSDALKDHLRAEREVLRELTPDVPVTTNFMVMGGTKGMDYADWADEVDFVANDHYVIPGPRDRDELSFSASLTSGISGHRPWFLMEHSTSAVNWQPVNLPKQPGELARDSLLHVAHGADAVCFFQWRQSRAGAEKYHSAMVPHAGEDSELFRSVVALGRTLERLAPIAGSEREPARVAVLFDWDSWWAGELDSHPTSRLDYHREALDWYTALFRLGVRADIVPAHGTDLSGYDVVVAPVLHVVPQPLAKELTRYAENGGHLVTTYFSAIVDENDHVHLGGYPGALRELLGIRIEEFGPLLDGDTVGLDGPLHAATGSLWTDRIGVEGPDVEVLARYRTGSYASRPAVTRRTTGAGSAAYVSTRLGVEGLAALLPVLLGPAGVSSELPEEARGAVEHVVRRDATHRYVFLVNRTDAPVTVPGTTGEVLAGPALTDSGIVLPPREVAVLRRPVG
ncbi:MULTISPECIES: beta-galactosidase [unclassified Streptomyces]|uniref:beta-galactosidase n=1 Tax=unclassified Streptomyces TaxID=2593676 RepID=UPI000DB9AF7D|nr:MULTISPECIES: beta-galactosidase [unclassified Streptomyces]MYT75715.1 beta-galactosidase [Streptomyces sp. SID8367]RAJ87123.1 beta-galactosidase [Streptomyces sp. PsTaAH-137]